MAISQAFSGTATISTTEYSLTGNSTTVQTQTTDGVYQCFLDLSALTIAETYDLLIKEKVISTGTQNTVYRATFSGPQASPYTVLPSLLLLHGWDITMDKVAGTDRVISWSIRQVA